MLELVLGIGLIWLGITLLSNRGGQRRAENPMANNVQNQYNYNFYCNPAYAKDVNELLRESYEEDYRNSFSKALPEPAVECEAEEVVNDEPEEVSKVVDVEEISEEKERPKSVIRINNLGRKLVSPVIKMTKSLRKEVPVEPVAEEIPKKKKIIVGESVDGCYSNTDTAALPKYLSMVGKRGDIDYTVMSIKEDSKTVKDNPVGEILNG